MQHLDLTVDTPADFEGRVVSIQGRDYVIGPSFREGDQGFAHLLRNRESGLCLHMIQIRPEYRSDPDLALALSRQKAETTAELRARMRLEEPEMVIPGISVVEAHGGSFELHEGSWGVFDSGEDAPEKEALKAAVSQYEDGDAPGAIRGLEGLLERHPNHTEALMFLADYKASQGKHSDALGLAEKAVAIEPNSYTYLGMRVGHALNASFRYVAMEYFEVLRSRFPLVDDFNAQGMQAYLVCGEPEKAEALLEGSLLPDDQQARFEDVIAQRSVVNRAYDAIDKRMARPDRELGDKDREALIKELETLQGEYPEHPWIQANLGLLLRKQGEPERGAVYLSEAIGGLPVFFASYCSANAGLAMVEAGQWDGALFRFGKSVAMLRRLGGGKVHALDVPGSADWLSRAGRVTEDAGDNPVALVDQAINNASSRELVTPDVLAYREGLAEAFKYYTDGGEDKSPPFGFFLVVSFAFSLAGLAFLGAISLFLMPFDQSRAVFGGVLLASVAIVLAIARRMDYVKAFFVHHLPLFVLPAIGFAAGVVVAVIRSFSGHP